MASLLPGFAAAQDGSTLFVKTREILEECLTGSIFYEKADIKKTG
jgi:hypothetical protein